MPYQKGLLRFLTAGSVDDGKSTLIGRLLYDGGGIYDDQLASVQQASRTAEGYRRLEQPPCQSSLQSKSRYALWLHGLTL